MNFFRGLMGFFLLGFVEFCSLDNDTYCIFGFGGL